ncbi:MAG: TetR/AcrR family transcriptional regulator [Solirubrobacteraceae bacterium]|jgi:AcrR family transcriptional regulator
MTGLRERKKRQTRAAIARAAAELFAAHGFESVSIDDVARAADVSRQTVFNYFPSKERILFDRDAEVEAALLAAVRDRPEGASLVSVFRAHTRAFWTRLDVGLGEGPLPPGFWEIVEPSPTLRAYLEATFARHAQTVARQLAAERNAPDDDPLCHALARALCGVNAAILTCGLHRLTRGDDPRGTVADMLAQADLAYDQLEHGLAGDRG